MKGGRKRLLAALGLLLVAAGPGHAVDVYLTLEEAPKAVFPEADSFERKDIQVTPEFRQQLEELVGRAKPTIWEPFYITFIARRGGEVIGYAVICEEIGKHRPITFIVAATPEMKVKDVAVMMYREPIGSEIRYGGFLEQFRGKDLEDPIRMHRDIRNISGATLSVQAMSRGVRKGLAVLQLVYGEEVQEKDEP
ncbi:MAG: FMN-binding protein [Terriglobia bacterium]